MLTYNTNSKTAPVCGGRATDTPRSHIALRNCRAFFVKYYVIQGSMRGELGRQNYCTVTAILGFKLINPY